MSLFTKIGGLGKATRTDFTPRSDIPASDVQAAIEHVDAQVTAADADIADVTDDVAHLVTLTGRPVDSDDMGTFSGSTIPDASDTKEALQALETAHETLALVVADKVASADLASTANGKGASLVGIEDAGGLITATTVEGALAEHRALINALDAAVILKGTWDASSGSFPGSGSAQAGWSYIVSVGGTVDGTAFVANDRILAIADNASTSTYSGNWHKLDYTDQVLSVNTKTGAVTITLDELAPTTTRGDIITRGASGNQRLALGSTGDVLTSDGTDAVWAAPSGGSGTSNILLPQNFGLSVVGASNDLTISLLSAAGNTPAAGTDSVRLPFRSSTLTTGLPVFRDVTSSNTLVIPGGGRMGLTTNSVPFRLWFFAADDAGTVRLGAIMCSTFASDLARITRINPLRRITSTQIGTGADSAHTFYTAGAAVTNKAICILGFADWDSGLSNIDQWTSPDYVQLFGAGCPLPGDILQTLTCDGSSTLNTSTTPTDVTGTTLAPTLNAIMNLTSIEYYGQTRATAAGAGANSETTTRIYFGSSPIGQQGLTGVVSGGGTNQQSDGVVGLRTIHRPASLTPSYSLRHNGLNALHNNTTTVRGILHEIMG